MNKYINHNGTIISDTTPVLSSSNRAFRFGDALFETIRLINQKPQLLKSHYERLIKGMRLLKMNIPEYLTEDFLRSAIIELAKKSNLIGDSRVRFTVYRADGGYYSPDSNDIAFLMEIIPLETNGYALNFKGLTIDIYSEIKKTPSFLSSIKSANSLLYVMAGIYKTEKALDDCIIMNDKMNIIESIDSNIFAVKNGVLYTPPVSEGCVEGVMRKKIIELAQINKIAVYEIPIMQNVLLASDELFLTNTISGTKWIVAYKQKRYFNNTAKKFNELLNKLAE